MEYNDVIFVMQFCLRACIDSTYALPTLERQLAEYISNPVQSTQEFKLESIPVISKSQEEEERRRKI